MWFENIKIKKWVSDFNWGKVKNYWALYAIKKNIKIKELKEKKIENNFFLCMNI